MEVKQKNPQFWLTYTQDDWRELQRVEVSGREGDPIGIDVIRQVLREADAACERARGLRYL